VVVDYVPRPSQLEAVAADAPAQQRATSATGESIAADAAADVAVVRPAQSPAAERRSEFGFER
jgi:septal ring-binding cell division protein DamX